VLARHRVTSRSQPRTMGGRMFCPTRILVPVDFSVGSRAAYEYACDMARAFGSAVDLLHVVSNPFTQNWSHLTSLGGAGDASRAWQHDALCELQEFARENPRRRRRTTVTVRAGVAAQAIAEYADERQCDLIVMGAHESLGAADLMRGNTTERVLRLVHCPVLAVPPLVPTLAQLGNGACETATTASGF
jgi:nucleotide-binding universal stress UspA family protein